MAINLWSRETLDERLLPCPFCGGCAGIMPWHGGGKMKRRVRCLDEFDTCDVGPGCCGDTPMQARKRWNTRSAVAITAALAA